FQAEDGIRGRTVTGVQTCALPISDEMEAAFICRVFLYARSIPAVLSTRSLNAASISSAASREGRSACGVSLTLTQRRVAFSITDGSVAGSSALKSAGTLELLMRSASGSRHLALYGSSRRSSNERIVDSGLSIKSTYRIRWITSGP